MWVADSLGWFVGEGAMELRDEARGIFADALRAVRIDEVMQREVRCVDGVLRVKGIANRLADFERVVVVAMGKAAGPMADGVLLALRGEDVALEGVVVGATAPTSGDARVKFLRGSHPIPDARSAEAADAVLELLGRCDEQCLVLVLLSGGASSMVERPLSAAMTMEDAAELHRALVHSGLAIGEMNALRKHFSAVKGGRLAVAAGAATICTLIVSDVPPEAMDVVGSGPTVPDATTVERCRGIIRGACVALELTETLRAYFDDPNLKETPKARDAAFARAEAVMLLSSDDLCAAASASAAARGFEVVVDNSCDEWEYREAARYLLDRAEALAREHERVCLVSAGEVSVVVQGAHGRGGRNQQFVLECARLSAERGVAVTVLSAGSDGIDGNSPAAGGVVDGTTVGRARVMGLSVEDALAGFDSYGLLAALGDAIETGATGNNLRDLRLMMVERVPQVGI
jgi:glycerate 2-kinase